MYQEKTNQPVFLYSGQGELQVGIGQDIYDHSQAAREVFDVNPELRELCFNGPFETLNDPYNNQAANFMAWMAISAAMGEINIQPGALAGQSLGEYGALCHAGSFSVRDALPMLKKRAKLMTDLIPADSGMHAILGLGAGTVESICQEVSTSEAPCQVAIYSTADRNVITGSKTAVKKCAELCDEAGGKTMPVRVARAFHSSLGQPAKEAFADVLKDFTITQPDQPVYYNRDGSNECKDISGMLADQLVNPVYLVKVIQNLLDDGYRQFIKIGPGGFFGDAVRSIARDQNIDVKIYSVESFEDINQLALALKEDTHA
jgi:[acyl-carrier-protein] S-malonyltransferase